MISFYSLVLLIGAYTLVLQYCKRLCLQSAVMKMCGCFHPLYLDFDADRNGTSPCNLTDGGEEKQ